MSNLLEKYRATQRRIRRYFALYTASLCPACPDPCCIKPTKVAEFDVLLANACGCSLPSANNNVADLIEAGIDVLIGNTRKNQVLQSCDYMGPDGCVFPNDLRPYQCVRYICPFLKREMNPGDAREVRALLHKLGVLHRELLEAVTRKR